MKFEDKIETVKEKFKVIMKDKGIFIFKVVGYYTKKTKVYMLFIFFKTDAELKSFSNEELEKLKKIYINLLKEEYIIDRIEKLVFYFDSDENVQKNYNGSYWLATL